MTTFRKGDTVFRVRSMTGIDAYENLIVTEGGKSHIKVRLANGVESGWLAAGLFHLNRRAHPDHHVWLVAYRNPQGAVITVVKGSRQAADEFIRDVLGLRNHPVVSAKKITIPLDYVGVA